MTPVLHAVPSVPPLSVPWAVFVEQAPGLAERVRSRFAAQRHHVLATLTFQGAPRVSGTEVVWVAGRLAVGSMPGARKADDLRRDPRFALHSNPGDGSMRDGDAKLQGRAVPLSAPEVEALLDATAAAHDGQRIEGGADGFWLDLTSATLTSVDGELLRVETWRPGAPVVVTERR